MHLYERSPFSGAGNCHCGMAEHSRAHPHEYTQAWNSDLCVCAWPATHRIHTDAATARPVPVLAGLAGAREAVRRARGLDAAPQAPVTFVCQPEAGAAR